MRKMKKKNTETCKSSITRPFVLFILLWHKRLIADAVAFLLFQSFRHPHTHCNIIIVYVLVRWQIVAFIFHSDCVMCHIENLTIFSFFSCFAAYLMCFINLPQSYNSNNNKISIYNSIFHSKKNLLASTFYIRLPNSFLLLQHKQNAFIYSWYVHSLCAKWLRRVSYTTRT